MINPTATFDKAVLQTFLETFTALQERGILTPTMTLDKLKTSVDDAQRTVVEQIISLRPQDYGVNTPYAGDLEPVPDGLVTVSGQNYAEGGQQKTLGIQYVPRHVFEAYTRMNEKFMAAYPEHRLLIASCYRSPAYQVIVFIRWLINGYIGDIAQTIRHASPPNYSQHTLASKAAIDFMNIDGSPSDDHPEDFKSTAEYAWLQKHANDFNFYESWQEGNEFGMRAEPWHWQYRGKRA